MFNYGRGNPPVVFGENMSVEISHLADLKRQSEKGYCTFSGFLGLSEQNELNSSNYRCYATLFGGYQGAERVVAGFGACENGDFPICCIKVKPLNKKFADNLSHRDFLGSLMGLGIKREVLGDIIVNDNCGYVFCLKSIAEFICDNLHEIKHTTVNAQICEEIPETVVPAPETQEHVVSSLRLDVLVASVFNLSRSKAGELFAKEKVFVCGTLKNASYTVSEGDSITVRGFGRFVFAGELRRTKKDRIVVELKIYK